MLLSQVPEKKVSLNVGAGTRESLRRYIGLVKDVTSEEISYAQAIDRLLNLVLLPETEGSL